MHASTRLTRRSFLGRLALAGAALTTATALTGLPPLPTILCAEAATAGGRAVTRTYLAMGTFVAMTVIHDSDTLAEEAMGRALEEIRALEAQLSRFAPGSALAVLNDVGHIAAPPELAAVVSRSRTVHALSAGAFDPTILPVLELVSQSVDEGGEVSVSRTDLRLAMERTGLERVRVRGRDKLSMGQGMSLTLDGVAKGHIVDRACAALERAGSRRWLVNAGGDIRCAGGGWTVTVQDPAGQDPAGPKGVAILALDAGAVATSGGYEIAYGRHGLYNHVIDPRTGRSPHLTAGATVTAPTAAEADALSTAALIMRPGPAMDMVRSLPGRHVLLVAADGARLADPGWPGA